MLSCCYSCLEKREVNGRGKREVGRKASNESAAVHFRRAAQRPTTTLTHLPLLLRSFSRPPRPPPLADAASQAVPAEKIASRDEKKRASLLRNASFCRATFAPSSSRREATTLPPCVIRCARRQEVNATRFALSSLSPSHERLHLSFLRPITRLSTGNPMVHTR
jgi:hypothetical protein